MWAACASCSGALISGQSLASSMMPSAPEAIACRIRDGPLVGSRCSSYSVACQPIALAAASAAWTGTEALSPSSPAEITTIFLPFAARRAVGALVVLLDVGLRLRQEGRLRVARARARGSTAAGRDEQRDRGQGDTEPRPAERVGPHPSPSIGPPPGSGGHRVPTVWSATYWMSRHAWGSCLTGGQSARRSPTRISKTISGDSTLGTSLAIRSAYMNISSIRAIVLASRSGPSGARQ